MSHEEAEDLLGAYALDALPVNERRQVEAHLLTCSEHRVVAAALGRTAGRLAFAVPEAQPSATLRSRILQAIEDAPPSPSVSAQAGQR